MIRRVCCNVYVNIQHVNKIPACLQYYFMWASSRTDELKKIYKNVEV